MAERGELYWIAPDALRPAHPGQRRPHVVVQDDVLNRSRVPTTVVCAISTNLRRATEPGNVRLDAGEGGLLRASVVIVSQVSTVDVDALGERIGALSDERVERILAGLAMQQRSFG